jgi:CBS domain-containing protein
MALPVSPPRRHNGAMTTAADLVTAPAIEVWPDTTLRAFAELLTENDIGAVLVRASDGGVAGVASERDLVRAVAGGADADVDRVSDHMTFDVEFASASLDAGDLATMMLRDGIRHLPVESNGKVVGVLSIRDVLAAVTAA